MKIEVVPRSKQTVDGKWVPAVRLRFHDGPTVTDQDVFDRQNRLFDTKDEADAFALELGKVELQKQGHA